MTPQGASKRETKLVSQLHHGKVPERVAALGELRAKMGARAVEVLCAALRDPHVRVRTTAATELGLLRDPGAIQPLIQALRASLQPKSRIAFRAVDAVEKLGWLAALVLAVLRYWHFAAASAGLAILVRFCRPLLEAYWALEHDDGNLQAAIASALAEIAEHRPSPAAAAVVEELRGLCTAELSEIRATREQCSAAAARIEAATAAYRQLPLAAAAPASSTDSLPLPAGAPEISTEALPRVHE